MAIRSRSCRACESASICLWPSVVTVAALLAERRWLLSEPRATSTPTVTGSSAKVNPSGAFPVAGSAVRRAFSPKGARSAGRPLGASAQPQAGTRPLQEILRCSCESVFLTHRAQFLSNAASVSTDPRLGVVARGSAWRWPCGPYVIKQCTCRWMQLRFCTSGQSCTSIQSKAAEATTWPGTVEVYCLRLGVPAG